MKLKRFLSIVLCMAMVLATVAIPAQATVENFRVYQLEDFEDVTDSATWLEANRTTSMTTSFLIDASWKTYVEIADDNNYLKVEDYARIYPLHLTPGKDKYVFEFDFALESFKSKAIDWQKGVAQVALGSTYGRSYSDILFRANGEADANGDYTVDTLVLFGTEHSIKKEGWFHFEVIYDVSNMNISVTGTDEADNKYSGSYELKNNWPSVQVERGNAASGGEGVPCPMWDNFKIYDYVDVQLPDSTGRYYRENFESVTDPDAWLAGAQKTSNVSPIELYFASHVGVELGEENNYLKTLDYARIWPFHLTTGDGKYVTEFDMTLESFTSNAKGEQGGMFMIDLGSTYGKCWKDVHFKTSQAEPDENGNYKVDTLSLFGTDYEIKAEGWFSFVIVYDCQAMTIEVTATDEAGNKYTASQGLKKQWSDIQFEREGATNQELEIPAGYIDNIEIYDYVEPVIPDEPDEPEVPQEKVYQVEDFEEVTDSAAWVAANKTTSNKTSFEIFDGSNVSIAIKDDNNYLQTTNYARIWPNHLTPGTGKYVLEFDMTFDKFTTKSTSSGIVAMIDTGSSWAHCYMDVNFRSSQSTPDADGNYKIDQISIYNVTYNLSNEGWYHFEIVYDCEAMTISVIVTDEEGLSYKGTNTLKNVASDLQYERVNAGDQTLDMPVACFDNFKILDYVEPVEPEKEFTGVFYEEDFEAVTNSDKWVNENASKSEKTPFEIPAGADVSVALTEENNYLQAGYYARFYPLSLTSADGKYLVEFDFKPESFKTKTKDWQNGVGHIALGSTYKNSFADILFKTNQSATDADGNYTINVIRLFGTEFDILNEGWFSFDIIYDCENMEITVKATDAGGNVYEATQGLAKVDVQLQYERGSSTATAEEMPLGLMDNIKISEIGEETAPVLKAEDIKIFANELEQKASNVSPFTNKVVVNFAQKMWPSDMTDEKVYVVEKGTPNKVSALTEYADGTVTISFAEDLKTGKTYTVTVEKVRNIGGVYTTEVYSKDFTIKGGVAAQLISVVQDGNAVTSFADLAAGRASVNISYSNTEDTTPVIHLVVGYYNEGRLVDIDFIKWETREDLPLIDYEFYYTVSEKVNESDKVQFMVWDGFDNLQSLSKPITLR